jgi:hypothetical protein
MVSLIGLLVAVKAGEVAVKVKHHHGLSASIGRNVLFLKLADLAFFLREVFHKKTKTKERLFLFGAYASFFNVPQGLFRNLYKGKGPCGKKKDLFTGFKGLEIPGKGQLSSEEPNNMRAAGSAHGAYLLCIYPFIKDGESRLFHLLSSFLALTPVYI